MMPSISANGKMDNTLVSKCKSYTNVNKKEAYGSHSPDWVMKFISKEKEKVPD